MMCHIASRLYAKFDYIDKKKKASSDAFFFQLHVFSPGKNKFQKDIILFCFSKETVECSHNRLKLIISIVINSKKSNI